MPKNGEMVTDLNTMVQKLGLNNFVLREAEGFVQKAFSLNQSPESVAELFRASDNKILHDMADTFAPSGS